MFLSHSSAIENRPGLEDQQIQKILKKLAELKAPEISSDFAAGRGGNALPVGLHQLIQYLSDWHLLVFLRGTGLYSEVRNLYCMSCCCSDDELRTIGSFYYVLQVWVNRETTISSVKRSRQVAGRPL